MANKSLSSFIADATAIALLISLIPTGAQASIGVCYGRLGDNLPSPSDVVKLYKQNGLGNMRIYDADAGVLGAVSDSGISLLIGVFNQDLQSYASSATAARDWVNATIISQNAPRPIRYVSVGNEVIPGELAQYVLPAMKNIQAAIDSFSLQSEVKVSTAVSMAVLGASYPPSAGAFSDAAKPFMGPIVQYLASTGAPLLLNLYPYFAYRDNRNAIALDYALFTSPAVVVKDGQFEYMNLFDAMVDAAHAAMEEEGARDVRVVVSETGWPSAGDFEATVSNAQTYNQNLIRHVGKGTPRRAGVPLEAYIFAMFNENQKQPELEKHWGLFNPDMTPAYSIEFS